MKNQGGQHEKEKSISHLLSDRNGHQLYAKYGNGCDYGRR